MAQSAFTSKEVLRSNSLAVPLSMIRTQAVAPNDAFLRRWRLAGGEALGAAALEWPLLATWSSMLVIERNRGLYLVDS